MHIFAAHQETPVWFWALHQQQSFGGSRCSRASLHRQLLHLQRPAVRSLELPGATTHSFWHRFLIFWSVFMGGGGCQRVFLPFGVFLEMTLAFGTSADFPRNPTRAKYKRTSCCSLETQHSCHVLIPCHLSNTHPPCTLKSLLLYILPKGSDVSVLALTWWRKEHVSHEGFKNSLELFKEGARSGMTGKLFCITKHRVPRVRHKPTLPHVHTHTPINHSLKYHICGRTRGLMVWSMKLLGELVDGLHAMGNSLMITGQFCLTHSR